MEATDYIIDPETGCWEWQRMKNSDGYGQFMQGRKVVVAHRHYYELYIEPIPFGLVIDHLCRNKACVNPHHLEAVTRAVNNQRGLNAKLTPEKVAYIRRLWASGEHKQVDLAKQFGVHRRHISNIVRNLNWREAEPIRQ
jgi:hypothetical protein